MMREQSIGTLALIMHDVEDILVFDRNFKLDFLSTPVFQLLHE